MLITSKNTLQLIHKINHHTPFALYALGILHLFLASKHDTLSCLWVFACAFPSAWLCLSHSYPLSRQPSHQSSLSWEALSLFLSFVDPFPDPHRKTWCFCDTVLYLALWHHLSCHKCWLAYLPPHWGGGAYLFIFFLTQALWWVWGEVFLGSSALTNLTIILAPHFIHL